MKLFSIKFNESPEEYQEVDEALYGAKNANEAAIIFEAAPIIEGYYIALGWNEHNACFTLRVYTLR